ncbi:MAG: hypothetical protein HRT47_10780 [Candidatus Caenarcaniphilales bacterium]|nr:hypothetical protein [Candidatus Caenarcaniphilales bacterium]
MKYKTNKITLLLAALLLLTTLTVDASSYKYTSNFNNEAQIIGDYNLDDYNSAKLRVVQQAWINLPPEEALVLVSNELPKWIDVIEDVKWDNSKAHVQNQISKSSERTCRIGNKIAVEDIRIWDDQDDDLKLYAYSLNEEKSTTPFPIKNYFGVLIIERKADNTSLITQRAYFDKKFHIMAPFISTMMKFKIFKPAFKKLAEDYNGKYIIGS